MSEGSKVKDVACEIMELIKDNQLTYSEAAEALQEVQSSIKRQIHPMYEQIRNFVIK